MYGVYQHVILEVEIGGSGKGEGKAKEAEFEIPPAAFSDLALPLHGYFERLKSST